MTEQIAEKTQAPSNTVFFVAGKSGGHILPAITLAAQHKQKNPQDTIVFISTDAELDKKIVLDTSGYISTYYQLSLDALPTSYKDYFSFFKSFYRALRQSMRYLKEHRPQSVIAMGGFITIPVCIAAYLLKIPFDIYELNVIPGKANKFLAPWARTIFICFGVSSTYFKRSCSLVGYPIRFRKNSAYPFEKIIEAFNFSPYRRTLLVLGGSQGSVFINHTIKGWLEHSTHLFPCIQIIHQTGTNDEFDWQEFYTSLGVSARVVPYCNLIELYYRISDVVICRAGAGTLFECLFFGRRCITIPLETNVNNHQVHNAQAMTQQFPHLFSMIRQEEIEKDPKKYYDLITEQLTKYQTNFILQRVDKISSIKR